MAPQKSKSPVDIAALQVKVRSVTYTYSRGGLQMNGHCFDPDVAKFLPPVKPVLTKKGTVKVHQPYIKEQPLAYWKAQCAFRNLPRSGKIPSLQQRLRKAPGMRMAEDLVQAEKDLKEGAWTQNWKTDEQKAEADPARFLREKLMVPGERKNSKSADVVVLKTNLRLELHEAASRLGLCHQSVDAPLQGNGSQPKVGRWIVIGRSQSAVDGEIQKVSREAGRMKQLAQDALEERKRRLSETIVGNKKQKSAREDALDVADWRSEKVTSLAARMRQTDALGERKRKLPKTVARSEKKRSAGDDGWDVAGSWAISCPYVESNWGKSLGRGSRCSLDIRFTKSSRRGEQMWAKFDFIVIKGVFRFENPSAAISSGKSKSKPTSSSERSYDDEGDSDECTHDSEGDSGEYTSEDDDEFYFGVNERPSPNCPQWNFRWRGEETGEGEIELDSDKKLCSVTFRGVGGSELSGWLISDLTGKIKFTGLKTGPSKSSTYEETIEDEWSSRNEDAYESARVGRW